MALRGLSYCALRRTREAADIDDPLTRMPSPVRP
jgi:hypothetical protein